ncbi:MAG TPA: GTPase HflX, partial [Saprospiraceae bacterium]|nr:GTPase HflX [Saprospiraceae bacterium]
EQTKREIMDELQQSLKTRFEHDNVFISAHTGENIPLLREKMTRLIKEQYRIRYPYQIKQW